METVLLIIYAAASYWATNKVQLMFPLKFYSKTYIMQQICSEYNGKNVHALARKYGYSESRVRQILREAKDEIV